MGKRKLSFSLLCIISFVIIELLQFSLAQNDTADPYLKPYVKIKNKKFGSDIASIGSTGFIDLRYFTRVIVCVNGPVILYSKAEEITPSDREKKARETKDAEVMDLSQLPPTPTPLDQSIVDYGPRDEAVRFYDLEIKFYMHKCFSINKVSKLDKKILAEGQGSYRKTFPRLQNTTEVMGKRLTGIFLVGNEVSYLKEEIGWVTGPSFEYIKSFDPVVKDASIIVTNAETKKCIRRSDGTGIVVQAAPNHDKKPDEYCFWYLNDINQKKYNKVFRQGFKNDDTESGKQKFNLSNYTIENCPGGEMGETRNILEFSLTSPAPILQPTEVEFDPFAMLNPNEWTPHGKRQDSNGLSGGDERADDRNSPKVAPEPDMCSLDPEDPACWQDMEEEELSDMQNVEQDDAEIGGGTYNLYFGECKKMVTSTGQSEMVDNKRRLVEIVLEVEPQPPVPPLPTPLPPGVIVDGNLNENSNLTWKYDVLYMAAEIFSHLCMPFRPEMPYTVARVFAAYLYTAHMSGQFENVTEKLDPWPVLINDLERCRETVKDENKGNGLVFEWGCEDSNGAESQTVVQPRTRKKRSTEKRWSIGSKFGEENAEEPFSFDTETVEEIEAETETKILSREKRASYNRFGVNGSMISYKYMQEGKTLASAKSEGSQGYKREIIQEYRPKADDKDPRQNSDKYIDVPSNVHYCWGPYAGATGGECTRTEALFYYEDKAEIEYDLNIGIDLWWKIWTTVLGYCNKAYHSRKSETFPRLFNAKVEYFFEPVEKLWQSKQDNKIFDILFSELLTDESNAWLDTCLEGSYVASNSHTFRPPRPMIVSHPEKDNERIPNYFEEIPNYQFYRFHYQPDGQMV